MTDKAGCPKCDSWLTMIYQTGYCPNGCLGGVHDFEGGYSEFCGAYLPFVGEGTMANGRKVAMIGGGKCSARVDARIHLTPVPESLRSWL